MLVRNQPQDLKRFVAKVAQTVERQIETLEGGVSKAPLGAKQIEQLDQLTGSAPVL